MRKQKSHRRVVAAFVLTLSLFAAWFALPIKYQRRLEPTAFAAAKTFTVDTGSEGSDVNLGDGICDSIPGAGTSCSLRAAIEESNANPGKDTINFNFAGGGVRTLAPTSALPTITDPVIIDGYSQPGASANTLANGDNAVLVIQLQGSNAGSSAIGLTITAGNSTVKGLVINLFKGDEILLSQNGSNTIQGNFIGTNAAGTAGTGSISDGVGIVNGSSNNLIGGTTPDARNLMSGNQIGVFISGNTEIGNQVQGNFIGTDASGTAAIGNAEGGVIINGGSFYLIGGAGAGARNIISGNNGDGLSINLADSSQVQGNFIGTDVTGVNSLSNTLSGLVITGGTNSTIGGAGTAGNIVAFNGTNGVTVNTNGSIGTGNSILSNSIFTNTKLGIDLGNNGVTPNDLKDPDTGANNLQNFPVITSAAKSGGNVLISGTINSTPNTSFTIELFSNSTCDPTGNGEGQKLIGVTTATADSGGDASFFTAASMSNLIGSFITATATAPDGNTSEFSQCTQLSTPLPVVQFGQSSYSTFEDCTAVTITVARGGDTSTAASVAYTTQSGTASERSDSIRRQA